MGRQTPAALVGAAAVIAASILTRAEPMAENREYLQEAQGYAKAFESQLEPELLGSAYMALENVVLAREEDPKLRAKLRSDCLALWLYLLQLLDRYLDPGFDPQDVPDKLVEPPELPGGIVLRPGADPARIDDPQVRADYEQAIAANRAKAERYRFQVGLHRLDTRIGGRAEAFIRSAYTFAPSDREEAKSAILKAIKNPERQAGLLRACYEPD
jgi:hypothetical protein